MHFCRLLPGKECIEGLCDLMISTDDPKLLDICLSGLSNFLMDGETEKKEGNSNVYAEMVEKHPEGFQSIQKDSKG